MVHHHHTTEGGPPEGRNHLIATFKQNGYPLRFIHSISSMQKSTLAEDPEDEELQEKPPSGDDPIHQSLPPLLSMIVLFAHVALYYHDVIRVILHTMYQALPFSVCNMEMGLGTRVHHPHTMHYTTAIALSLTYIVQKADSYCIHDTKLYLTQMLCNQILSIQMKYSPGHNSMMYHICLLTDHIHS